MGYLRLRRARGVLLFFLIASALFAWLPDLDLRASGPFFRGGRFPLAETWWAKALHESVGYFICIALAAVIGTYVFNKLSGRHVGGVDAKVVAYLFAVLILGAGLTVNVALKNSFGRARPRNVEQFGGLQQFTPAFAVGDECLSNCSFSSGDGAGACFALALALALSRRRAMLVAAAAFGVVVSFSRVAAGAHFLSDTVVSFFVMWITADVLYFYMLLPRQQVVQPAAVAAPGLEDSPAWQAPVLGTAPSYVRVSVGDPPHDPR